MAYTTEEGRKQLLEGLAAAAEATGGALAALGEAHELLDEQSAERLENELFAPVRRAYALLGRTRSQFAARSGLEDTMPEAQPRPAPSHGARGFLAEATEAIAGADAELAELQDSMLPVEVGDAELRSGITSARELLDPVGRSARELLRTLGR
jgi:hypothetical protein